jgi:AraC family transcriptional regulator
VCLSPLTASAQTGKGWGGFGPAEGAYAATIDTTVSHSGHASFLMYSLGAATNSTWLASQQIVDASPYRGRRVRLSGYLRTQNVSSADLWLVVNGVTGGAPMTLLSSHLAPPLHGTLDWQVGSIVFEVDSNATCLRFGATIHGTGAVWLDDVSVDTVSMSVAVTAKAGRPEPVTGRTRELGPCSDMLSRPTNLSFEE